MQRILISILIDSSGKCTGATDPNILKDSGLYKAKSEWSAEQNKTGPPLRYHLATSLDSASQQNPAEAGAYIEFTQKMSV